MHYPGVGLDLLLQRRLPGVGQAAPVGFMLHSRRELGLWAFAETDMSPLHFLGYAPPLGSLYQLTRGAGMKRAGRP